MLGDARVLSSSRRLPLAASRPEFFVSAQLGVALGAFLGARTAARAKARTMRYVVLAVLFYSAVNLRGHDV